MSLHYLLGPLLAGQPIHWQTDRAAGLCVAFDTKGDCDLTVAAIDSWDDIRRRLPHGWRPDFIALNLGYTSIPPCLWTTPAPLVGLAPDWNLLWHHYRRALRRCDLVLTDAPGVEALARGTPPRPPRQPVRLRPGIAGRPPARRPAHIDVLFVGNLQPAVQGERLAWLGRLARLAGRRKVVIATGIFGADYRALLARRAWRSTAASAASATCGRWRRPRPGRPLPGGRQPRSRGLLPAPTRVRLLQGRQPGAAAGTLPGQRGRAPRRRRGRAAARARLEFLGVVGPGGGYGRSGVAGVDAEGGRPPDARRRGGVARPDLASRFLRRRRRPRTGRRPGAGVGGEAERGGAAQRPGRGAVACRGQADGPHRPLPSGGRRRPDAPGGRLELGRGADRGG